MRMSVSLFLLYFVSVLLMKAYGATTVEGRVVDMNDGTTGIPGVTVEVFNALNKKFEGDPLAEARSDGDGNYSLSGVEEGDHLVVRHKRNGYLANPTDWEGVIGRDALIVEIMKKGASRAYYTNIGGRIASRSASASTSLEREWQAFRALGAPLEVKEVVREAVGRSLNNMDLIISIDATLAAAQINLLDNPEAALESARAEGFLPEIYFKFDSVSISGNIADNLKWTAAFLQASEFNLVIEGHADEKGTNEYNLALAEKRARAVGDYTQRLGLDQSKIRVLSYGEERPLCTDLSEECQSKNRRAELKLVRSRG